MASMACALCACAATNTSAQHGDAGGDALDAGGDALDATVMNADPIVINEVAAGPASWIELYNRSDAQASLGAVLFQADETNSSYVLLLKGNALGPHEYAVIVFSEQDGGGAPVSADGGASLHYQGAVRLDEVRGGRIRTMGFVGPSVGGVDFPAGLAAADATWGRVPDGSDRFALTRPTPGAPNVGR